jgi:hypothetical protein
MDAGHGSDRLIETNGIYKYYPLIKREFGPIYSDKSNCPFRANWLYCSLFQSFDSFRNWNGFECPRGRKPEKRVLKYLFLEKITMAKQITILACLILVISSCESSSTTARPLGNIPPTSTSVLEPFQTGPVVIPTVLSTITSPPTLMPPPAFSPHGPFLAFQDDPAQPTKITLFDPIQTGSFVISKPAGDILQWSAGGLSPDGQYLAYYSGHLDTLSDLSAVPAVKQQVELNIMRTVDGSIVFQQSLLNKDYPQNFLQAADSLLANPPAEVASLGYSSRSDFAASLLAAFTDFIYTNSWSPDGHVLAFASGADGPSSDVYTYNLDTGIVTRITDGPSQVYKIIWSPDGNWILNSGIYNVGEGMCGTWYLSAANGSVSSGFSIRGAVDQSGIRGCDFDEWVSDHQALVSEDANGRGIFNLEILDIHQKSIDLIWPHTFHSFAFDPVAQIAYISTAGEQLLGGTYFQQGTYQVEVSTNKTVSIAPDMLSLLYLGWESGETIAGIPQGSTDICFIPSGSCSGFPGTGQKQWSGLSVSANRNSLVLYSDTGLWHIFPESANKSTRRDYSGNVSSVTWSPNPDSNPANDLGMVESNSPTMPFYLYNPLTGLTNPLSYFVGYFFQGWYWRK